MQSVAGILLLMIGAIFPMGMLVWLNARLHRVPAPRPRQVGAWLAFNFVLPVGLVLLGLSLVSARIAAAPVIHTATLMALAASGLILFGLAVEAVLARRVQAPGGDDGR